MTQGDTNGNVRRGLVIDFDPAADRRGHAKGRPGVPSQPWRVFQRGWRRLTTNVTPLRRTTIELPLCFDYFTKFLAFMAFCSADTDQNDSRYGPIPAVDRRAA